MWLVAIAALIIGQAAAPELIPCGQTTEPALKELSGLVCSARNPSLFWAHGDSGTASTLFAIDAHGKLVCRVRIAAPNVDWEDIATDHRGNLYIGDIGNNFGRLPLRVIHEIAEPSTEPVERQPARTRPKRTFYIAYPGKPFDAEGLFVFGGDLVVVRKSLDRQPATLHAIPLDQTGSLIKPVHWKEVGVLPEFVEPATGADLSPDGVWLAVCANAVSRVYERQPDSWRLVATRRYPPRSIEAIAWDGDDLLLADEEGWIGRWPTPVASGQARR